MASFLYTPFATNLLSGKNIDLDTDTIKIALVSSSYTPDKTHDFFNDITNEVTGTGYTAGGATLASKTVTQDNTNFRTIFDAADATWSNSTITARYAVIYESTGVAATSPLIALIDFGSNISTVAETFQVPFNVDGILKLSIV